jgi:hypothetical protein
VAEADNNTIILHVLEGQVVVEHQVLQTPEQLTQVVAVEVVQVRQDPLQTQELVVMVVQA